MVYDGNKGSFADNSFVKPENSQQNLGVAHSQGVQRGDSGRNFMEMEGRGYSDFYRNSSEELFIKTLMEGSVGMPVPTMETLGFKNLQHNFRTDSEELFKSWLTNGENPGHNGIVHHRPRQASRRMFTDMANASTHQNGVTLQRKRSNENLPPQIPLAVDESSNDMNEHSTRNMAENGFQASSLFLAKAWFQSSQPMTRSRSSELRKRYVAMQNSQTAFGMEAMQNASGNGINHLKQEFHNPGGYNDGSVCNIPNQFNTFMSPSNSASSTFNTPQLETVDKVSSVVSMLKGTLERKKLGNQIKQAVEDSSLGYYGSQEVLGYSSLNQGQGNYFHEAQGHFQDMSTAQVEDPRLLQTVDGTIDVDLESFMAPMNPIQINNASREPSQSESSAPVVSTGFDACDGPSNSGQTLGICESSRMQVGNGKSSENGSGTKDIREQMYDNLKEDRKQKRSLVRYGSVTSAGSVDKGDPTKKRRVERSRKMAEAKERTLTPVIPSDMQSILKRCENLDKEVRSLKLNLSFMNRKDSEQTKQIEELQKQNEELGEEKERLLEEIERIISETGKISPVSLGELLVYGRRMHTGWSIENNSLHQTPAANKALTPTQASSLDSGKIQPESNVLN